MTTICTDGATIAADGQSCLRDTVAGLADRKIVVRDGAIYALSGAHSMLEDIIAWHRSGAKPADVPKAADNDVRWTVLVITRDATNLYSSGCAYPSLIENRRFAIGSGGEFAMGAMCAGLSPERAVRTVIDNRLDVWTGGEIQVVDIAEALGLAQVREAAE